MPETRSLRVVLSLAATLATALGAADSASAQWFHRYPKLSDFGHHTYLEQHELPILAHGPTDPAPAPDGRHLAFAARGWIWRLDLESGAATRLTSGPATDARPRWSPDGERLAFVRDGGRDTAIVVLDLASGRETRIDTPTIELDPEFSADGESLYYTSGLGDVLSLWRRHLASGAQERLTDLPQVERNARRLPGGRGLLYLHGAGPHRVLRARDFLAGTDVVVHRETLTYHLTADVHPTLRLAVYSAPIDDAYHLWTLDLDDPRVEHRLTDGAPFALTPAFSADGEHVFFVTLDPARQFRLMRIPTYGGEAQPVEISSWDYGEPTGRLSVRVTDAAGDPVTARVSVTRADGHPVAFHGDATYVDVQTGRPFFYVEGGTTLTVPAGDYTVLAARGPLVPMVEESVRVAPAGAADFRATLKPIWDARAAGYVSADHHVHLNGDGHHRADHDDALRVIAGEDLDLVAPMSWNRWERRIDAGLVGRVTARDGRIVAQGQEVRSHFHGHVGLNGVSRPFAPWFFGPRNPTLGNPDLTNGDVLAFADANGAFATYVHPVEVEGDPFDALEEGAIPLELASDAVLGERLGLELACEWTGPLAAAELWYRLLNVGRPVSAMSGTDSWIDFHRTVAVGTGRNYLRVEGGDVTAANVLDAAITGRGFVTTGPALVFRIDDDARPGEVVASGRRTWQALLASTTDIDVLEVLVNGAVVERLEGVRAGETRRYEGEVDLPEGGWVAARASTAAMVDDAWPTMHARPFAHSSPIWIGSIGSTEPSARRRAATDLIRAIDVSERQAREAYGEVETPRMQSRFDRARAALRELIAGAGGTP